MTVMAHRPGHWLFWRNNLRQTRIMRFAFGVTLTVALAFGIEWPLSFLTPVLTSVLLAMPIPGPSPRDVLMNIIYVAGSFALGSFYTLAFLPFPGVYAIMLAVALFHIYYLLNRGSSFMLVLMMLLAVLILPMLSIKHNALAAGFSDGFVLSGIVFVLAVWLSHQLFPDTPDAPPMPARPALQSGFSAAAAEAALKSTLVVWPVVILFVVAEWTGQILVMVFIAIFSLSPQLSKGRQAGLNSLASTFIGGMVALVVYGILVAVPEFYFLVLLMAVTSLFFAQRIFSNNTFAKYLPSAFTTLLVLISSSMGEDASFSSNFFTRIVYIGLATVYVVFALQLLESLWPDTSAATGQ